jgi:hypothetical protein
MPSAPTSVSLAANDVLAAIKLSETTDGQQVGAGEVRARAEVALGELVTLARAYVMVAYVEQVNGEYRWGVNR